MAGIVQDGRQRYVVANTEGLEQRWQQRKAEIESRYAERLEHVGVWRRFYLRLLMHRDLWRARLELQGYGNVYGALQGPRLR